MLAPLSVIALASDRPKDETETPPLSLCEVTNFAACDKRSKRNDANIVVLQLSVIGMESQKQALSSNFPYFLP